MTTRSTQLATLAALSALALAIATPVSAGAQARRSAPARRGTPGIVVPMTSASISLGAARYSATVDAECAVDPRAARGNGRAYYRVLYPWFGQRVGADKPQWRFTLEIRPAAASGSYDQFVFSLHDAKVSGTVQQIAGAQRMGRGTVRVTPHGSGARFDVAGTTKEGQPVRATIDCSRFQGSEAAGG